MNKYLVAASLLLLVFASCKTPSVITQTSPTAAVKTDNPMMDSMNRHRQHFDWFSGKAKVQMKEGNDQTEFTANIRIRQDSAIWVSISPALGVEVARVLITSDSIRAIDRIHRDYYSKGFDFFDHYTSFRIDLKTLQDLIEGNPLFTEGKLFTTQPTDSSLVLLVWDQDTLKNSILLNNRFQHLTQNITDGNTGSLSIVNDQFDPQYTPAFPMWRKIDLRKPHEATIVITFNKVKINDPQKLPFNAKE